eukprot:CAMPEP_0179930966 /NCGR_PEP_ID=MMETSP0983-20121128/10356_1 /TAXON_ID=483367 /ORGANISM="non described non described, Strain CCMP 2436" /LENGTH=61 /DNA_ID=CAMNT_0021835219 /DNA_START=1119 /DNA_END=1301 /DNA_ORIENTATION=-
MASSSEPCSNAKASWDSGPSGSSVQSGCAPMSAEGRHPARRRVMGAQAPLATLFLDPLGRR